MMKTFFKLLTVLVLLLIPKTVVTQGRDEMPVAVSLVQILANPEKFDGKLVSVTGFLGLDPPDGNMLYLHKEDYDHGILWNGVDIALSTRAWAEGEKLDQNYIRVIGVFESGKRSHSQFGAITKIERCVLWSQISSPIRGKLPGPRGRKP